MRKIHSILTTYIAFSMVTGVTFHAKAQSKCATLFQNETITKKTHKDLDQVRVEKFWNDLDADVTASFSKNLQNTEIYDSRLQHVRALERYFNFRPGSFAKNKTVSSVIEIYNKFMDARILEGQIAESDVIRPIFIFVLPDGQTIARQFGQHIPPEAQPYQKELPKELFEKLIRDGFFPIGNSSTTVGGARRTSFEHDLAHFTAFMEFPEYMGLLLRLHRDAPLYQDFLTNFGDQNSAMGSVYSDRLYLYFESMVVVNQAKKAELIESLLLSTPMRERIDRLTLKEIETHLATISDEELVNRFTFLRNHADDFFLAWGGAARNPGDRNFYINNKFNGSLFFGLEKLKNTSPDSKRLAITFLAQFQFYVIRFRNLTVQDWFDNAFKVAPSPGSNLFQAFEIDKEFSIDGFWIE